MADETMIPGPGLAAGARGLVILPARPEPIRPHPAQTAMIVVDTQNAHASPGG